MKALRNEVEKLKPPSGTPSPPKKSKKDKLPKIPKKNYVEKVKGNSKSPKRKGKSTAQKRKANNTESVAKVRVTLDMWQVIKNKKMLYDCPFTLWIDGRTYNRSTVSVFEPEDIFDKIKNELAPYFKNFLN